MADPGGARPTLQRQVKSASNLALSGRNVLSCIPSRVRTMQPDPAPKPDGRGQFIISTSDMGGWVRIFPDRSDDLPPDLPVFLSQALSDWFRQRPQRTLQTVVPVVKDGRTIELHAWYLAHVFPAIAGPKLNSVSRIHSPKSSHLRCGWRTLPPVLLVNNADTYEGFLEDFYLDSVPNTR